MAKKVSRQRVTRIRRDLELAVPVSQRVALEDVSLVETLARRREVRDSLPTILSLGVDIKTEVSRTAGTIRVLPRFTFVAAYDKAGTDELLRIEAVFLLRYSVPSFEGLTKANLDAFGETNGRYNAWPYWREYVQATTVRMGLPPLTMPVYRPLQATLPLGAAGPSSATRGRRPKKKPTSSRA